MQETELEQGLVVVARGAAATVVQCLPDLQVEVMVLNSQKRLLVGVHEIEFLPVRSESNLAKVNDLLFSRADGASYEEIKLAQTRFDVIGKYKKQELSVSAAQAELGISNGLFYKLVRLYDEDVGHLSLVRLPRGRKLGTKVLEAVIEGYIEKAIDKAYQGRAATYINVWKEVEALCIEGGKPIPSKYVVTARVKALDPRDAHKRKYGAESAMQKHGARPGKKETAAPLEHVQMDHTLVDLIICDAETREPIGRPWLTVIIDVHTRIILGYYLSLHAPSTVSVACAMTHAALPKQKFLEYLNNPLVKYPFFGVPRVIHMDNAKEFKSVKFQKACSLYNIEPQWRPLGRKHYGGHVERLIGSLMTSHVHFLPGATYSNTVQRRGYDSEKKSALTFKEFSRWFVGQVAIYHGTKHSSINMSPAKAWEKHFSDINGNTRYPPIITSSSKFKLDFMPEIRRDIHPWGIDLNNRTYWVAALTPFVGRKQVLIKYDPFSMGTIWVKLDDAYTSVNFADLTNADFNYEEYRAGLKGRFRKASTPLGALEDQSLVKVKRYNEDLVGESERLARAAKRKNNAAKKEYLDEQVRPLQRTGNAKTSRSNDKPEYSQKPTPFARGK